MIQEDSMIVIDGIITICICAVATVIIVGLCSNPNDGRPMHHDSRKGSYYEISNRKKD